MTIKQYVFDALKKFPSTRSNDDLLIYQVFREYAQNNGIPMAEVHAAARALGLFPAIRTIIRERQVIQAKHPELTDKKAVEEREAMVEECRQEYGPDSDWASGLELDLDAFVDDADLDFPDLELDI